MRLGRSLLANPQVLAGLNAQLAQLSQVSASVAAYTGSAAFTSGLGTLAAPQKVAVEATLKVDPASDPTYIARQVERGVNHGLENIIGQALTP